jgi:hypothetical protein
MTGLLRKAMLLACTGVLAASSAMAAVPSPADSDVPCGFNLVGTTGGVADPRGQFTIIVRDLAQNPIPGSSVVIDFNACTPDIRVCSVQPAGGVTADCSGAVGEINVVTDGAGTVVLRIVGGANNIASGTPAAGFKCATVYADGVNLGTVNVGAYDENGGTGVNPADVSVWLPDSFDGDFEGRSDFNCTNSINPADLSLLLGASLGGQSFNSCSSYCH